MGSTFFLYILTVLIWGSTWHVITFQLGTVPIELSVGYRFLLAGVLLFGWLFARGEPLKFSRKDHGFFLLQGALVYSGSYWLIYCAAERLSSGMNSIVFSIIIVLNVFFAAFFFKKPLTLKIISGAILGVMGISCIFLPDLFAFSVSSAHVMGLLFSIGGALASSLGNMVIERHHNHGIPVAQINAYSMTYGGILSLLYGHFMHADAFVFDMSFGYISSLLYLSVLGSVVTFGCYMILIKRIGVHRAGYPLVMIPLASLLISQLAVAHPWSLVAGLGVVLILLGNVLVVSNISLGKVWSSLRQRAVSKI